MLWYRVKHQLLLNKVQSFLWRIKLPWQQESLAETPYILALVAYLKNELGDPHFLLHKSDQQTKMKLSAKLKKKIVERIQSYLKFLIS